MVDIKWKQFFITCNEVLGRGSHFAPDSENWCAWTTFSRLCEDAGYWTAGLPNSETILDSGIADGGAWGQPFRYSDFAHIIIPSNFFWETGDGANFDCGTKQQNIIVLSDKIRIAQIDHRITPIALEIKIF